MAGIYSSILDDIERDPGDRLRRRVSLSTGQKLALAGRELVRSVVAVTSGLRSSSPAAGWPASPPPASWPTPGSRVTLLEKRPFLGGRAYSYTDKASGVEVDNGQHVFLGCCTEYIGFLERLGVRDKAHLQKRFRVPRHRQGLGRERPAQRAACRRRCTCCPSLLRFRSLSPAEKALRRLGAVAASSSRTARSTRSWTTSRSRSGSAPAARREHAIRSLWNLIVLPTLNGDISTRLRRPRADGVPGGLPALPQRRQRRLGEGRPVRAARRRPRASYIESRGGEVRLGDGDLRQWSVDGRARARPTARTRGRRRVRPGAAGEPRSLDARCRRRCATTRSSRGSGGSTRRRSSTCTCGTTGRCWDRSFAAFLNTPRAVGVQQIEALGPGRRRPVPGHLAERRRRVHRHADAPTSSQLFTKEMSRCSRRRAAPSSSARSSSSSGTPRSRRGPASRRLRPAQRTPVANLFLAGDWTATGWPATMESAVRSGRLAAREVLKAAGRPSGREVVGAT